MTMSGRKEWGGEEEERLARGRKRKRKGRHERVGGGSRVGKERELK